jgi:hypothetical protein
MFVNVSAKFEGCLVCSDNFPNEMEMVSKFTRHFAAELVYSAAVNFVKDLMSLR